MQYLDRCLSVAGFLLLAFGFTAWSSQPRWRGQTCAANQQRQVSETLYFGTATPDGIVSVKEWETFLRGVVTPLFPEGLTVWSASGQWRGTDKNIVREQTYMLNVIHDGDVSAFAKIAEISSDYKRRFRQEAVLDTRAEVCTSF